MKLQTRLFLSVGILLLFIAFASYLLPNFLIKQDINRASAQIRKVLKQKEIELLNAISTLVPQENLNTLSNVVSASKNDTEVFSILDQMKSTIVHKISLNLLGASLLVLAIALLLLARISRKVTKPISQLAEATAAVEKGHYFEATLPTPKFTGDEIAVLVHGFKRMLGAVQQREEIRGVLNKVVSKEIATAILQKGIELGGEERIATLFFSDVRGFTKLTEKVPPKLLITHVNRYLTEMCRLIDETGGVVDKFVGDEIMALYGIPIETKRHAVKAITAALKMMQSLQNSNEKRALEQLPPIEVGIGIHTGIVVAGNVGSENRLNYTVLGANVNLGSRLCSIAKGMQILISEQTLHEKGVKETFSYKELPPVHLKGFSELVKIYEIQDFKPGIPN